MYLILGRDEVIPEDDVIGIFDLDNASWSKRTREYLASGERVGRISNMSDGLPRTLIVTEERDYLVSQTPQRAAARTV